MYCKPQQRQKPYIIVQYQSGGFLFLNLFSLIDFVEFLAEASLRNATRTPNIFQNVEISPNQSAKLSDTTLSPGSARGVPSVKMQTLRQRKSDLDNLLTEKNNLLQQLCREEAKLLANCSANGSEIGLGIDCSDGHSMNAALRRRVDTGFKLPENLLNSKEVEINKYLLSKQIQQQISEASLQLANDMTQTKVSSEYAF